MLAQFDSRVLCAVCSNQRQHQQQQKEVSRAGWNLSASDATLSERETRTGPQNKIISILRAHQRTVVRTAGKVGAHPDPAAPSSAAAALQQGHGNSSSSIFSEHKGGGVTQRSFASTGTHTCTYIHT